MNELNDVVEFECVYGSASFTGYAYKKELGDDEPLHFYDENGFETQALPISQESDNEDETKLLIAFVEDFQFLQYLSDFANDQTTIDRGTYTLRINGGTPLHISYYENRFKEGTKASVHFKFGDVFLDDGLLEEMASVIGMVWNDDDASVDEDMVNTIVVKVDEHFFDPNYDSSEKEQEMEDKIECLVTRQLIMDKGVFMECWETYLSYSEECDEERDTICGSIANNFEQLLESEDLRSIDDICSKEMSERINDYIKNERE